ncbi:MAG: hypothetical protein J1F04_01635 [Oscillospiraceae bacterium]|nr:hypothetical protein [Oscillospiraceae bacterium]
MAQYAKNTSVSSENSRLEIERILIRYGADNFAYATAAGQALIGFTMNERQVKFVLPLPRKEEYSLTPTGKKRTENSQYEAWEQACRQRWRALKLVIQAKLEAVECGISVFEDEFMSNIVLPGGMTVGDFMKPQISEAYKLGKPPSILPMLSSGKESG